ncbi:MAG: hypothetical protein AAFX05_07805 [Planctomycetota bacterium]
MASGSFMTIGGSAKGLALGVGSNLVVLGIVDTITSDIQWIPGIGRAAVVTIVLLGVCAGYVLIRNQTVGFRAQHRQASLVLSIGFAFGALLSLLSYVGMHTTFVIATAPVPAEDGQIYVTAGLPAPEGFVQPPPFVRPLWIPGPRESSQDVAGFVSLHDYLATFVGEGGWHEAIEYDRRFLDERLKEYPLAQMATMSVFIALYVLLTSFITGSVAFALREPDPTAEPSQDSDDSNADESPPDIVVKVKNWQITRSAPAESESAGRARE